MFFKDREILSVGIEFIVESVALNTNGQDHSALGLYLLSLLLEDQKSGLDWDEKRPVVPIGNPCTLRFDLGWKCPSF